MSKESAVAIKTLSLEDLLGAKKVPTPEEIAEQSAWINAEVGRIGVEKLQELIESAVEARKKAINEFSGYAVGAAVLWSSGNIYAAFNIEEPAFTLTDHAEIGGIKRGIFQDELENGHTIKAIVICHAGKSQACGICRQYMIGFQENVLVIAVGPKGNPFNMTSLQILLPYSFGKKQIEEQRQLKS